MAALFEGLDADPAVEVEIGDHALIQAFLDVECALTRALVHAGIAPAHAADGVQQACSKLAVDSSDIGRRATASGNPIVPLVEDLRAAAPGDAPWIHHGATSQDILDTALMLVAKRALVPITQHLARGAAAAADLAVAHRHTLQVARTLGQQALPSTFGLKAAGWSGGLRHAADRLSAIQAHQLAVQLGGPVGTLAAYTSNGLSVVTAFARELELADPGIPWHTERSRIHELAGALGSATAAAGKVATDVIWMSQSEVGEVAEAGEAGHGASSAMPHKRNPSRSVLIMAAARRTPGLVGTILAAGVHEHERAVGSWHAEWRPLLELLRLAGGVAGRVADLLACLEVDVARMRTNLDAFLADPATTRSLGAEAVRDPALLLGATQAIIDRVLAAQRTDPA
jgi:3-carboxy-cis,cis-muconate cycloisomerase